MISVLRCVTFAANKIPKIYFRGAIRTVFLPKICEGTSHLLHRHTALTLSSSEKLNFRSKHTRKKKRQEEESESDEDEDESSIDEVQDKSAKILKISASSLRADLIIKAGLGTARNKVEDLFYASKLRLNGKKMFKKSMQLCVDDEVDMIRGVSPMNPNFLVVTRIKILSATALDDRIVIKLQRFQSLTIENYEDAWKDAGDA